MATWYDQLLQDIGAPITSASESFLQAWNQAEGNVPGHSGLGINNPLNTTNAGPGSYSVNSVGVQAFPSGAEGVSVNALTISRPQGPGWNAYFTRIFEALKSGDPASFIGSPQTDPQGRTFSQEFDVWGTGQSFLSRLSGGSSVPQPPNFPPGTATSVTFNPSPTGGPGGGPSPVTVTGPTSNVCRDFEIPIPGGNTVTLPGTRLFCEISNFISDPATWAKIGLTIVGAGLVIAGILVYLRGEV